MSQTVRTTASALTLRSLPIIRPDTDTGMRLRAGETATSFGETFDKSWQFLHTLSGNGWASSAYLQPAAAGVTVVPPVAAAPRKLLYTLVGEDPQLTAAIEKLRAKGRLEGIEFETADFGGVRTEADTTKILKYRDDDYAVYVRNLKATNPSKTPVPIGKWRPISPFGSSMHNFGCARDLKITKHPDSFSESTAQARLGALAPSCGLKWGGTFTTRFDGPHMELPITMAQARQRYEARI
jgi:hypothetical protein